MKQNIILSVDPSIVNCGWCLMDSKYLDSGVILTKGISKDSKRIALIWSNLSTIIRDMELIKKNPVTVLAIELPANYSYSRSTSKWSGKAMNLSALQKLNWTIGAIMVLGEYHNLDVIMIPVWEWKGRTKKAVDLAFAKRIAEKDIKSTDEADAICLADYVRKITRR